MVDYKSLIGDPSDNVPGIAGIGPKTAAQLLQKYHTLENLLKHISEVPESVHQKLEAGKDIALAAKKLVELDRSIDLGFKIEDLRFRPDWGKARKEYEDLGFKSIAAKLPFDSAQGEPGAPKGAKVKNSDQLGLI